MTTTKLLIDTRLGSNRPNLPGWLRAQAWDSRYWLDDTGAFDAAKTKLTALALNHDELVILDLEQWVMPVDHWKIVQVIDEIRKYRPTLRIGVYGVLPYHTCYWETFTDSLGNWTGKMQPAMQAINRQGFYRPASGRLKASTRGLVDAVDFVCPSLYTMFQTPEHQINWFNYYARYNLVEARKYNKQIYPFVWAREHTTLDPLDLAFFRRQCKYLLNTCDGVVVWDWLDYPNGAVVNAAVDKVMLEFVDSAVTVNEQGAI